jgi:hypothetical protein
MLTDVIRVGIFCVQMFHVIVKVIQVIHTVSARITVLRRGALDTILFVSVGTVYYFFVREVLRYDGCNMCLN